MSQPPHDEDWPTQPGRGQPPQQPAPARPGRHSQPDWIQPERIGPIAAQPDWNEPPPKQPQPARDELPTSQTGRHSRRPLSDETQPLPVYQQIPVAVPELWTAPPAQPPPFELPAQQFPPGGLWGAPPMQPQPQPPPFAAQPTDALAPASMQAFAPPPGRTTSRATVLTLAILGVLVVGGATIGLVVSSGGNDKHGSHQIAPSAGGGASSHDFPSVQPSGLRTDVASGTGAATAEQAQIAQNAEDVLHAIATDDAARFCPLIDPGDLQKLLAEKSLSSCGEIKLKSTADSPLYQSFAVENPAAITVSGDAAHIPAMAIVPTSFGAVDMRKDSDGTWKFRFYAS